MKHALAMLLMLILSVSSVVAQGPNPLEGLREKKGWIPLGVVSTERSWKKLWQVEKLEWVFTNFEVVGKGPRFLPKRGSRIRLIGGNNFAVVILDYRSSGESRVEDSPAYERLTRGDFTGIELPVDTEIRVNDVRIGRALGPLKRRTVWVLASADK